MKCPECGSKAYSVADKRDDYDANVTTRRRWCGSSDCGARWSTTERVDKGQTLTFMKRAQSIARRASPSAVKAAGQQTVKSAQQTVLQTQPVGKSASVCYPDPISSPFSKISDPDLTKQTKLQVDRARVPRLIAAFCEEWGKAKAPAKYQVTPRDRGQAKELFNGCPDLTDSDWRAACARYVRSPLPFFATNQHPLALLAGNLNQFTADAKPAHNGQGHSPVTAGKDYTAGMDLWKRKAAP